MKNLKNITFAAVILSVATMLGACSDFLDIKPKGKDVPENITHYNGLLNNSYITNFNYVMAGADGGTTIKESSIFWPYMGDDMLADATAFENMSERAAKAYTWAADIFDETNYCAEYQEMYRQLYIYNLIINNVMDAPDGTAEEKKMLQAEARANRAMNYLLLVQFFGKPYSEATSATDLCVSLVLTASSVETNFTRYTVKAMYDFIISELEEACPDLGEQTRSRLRIYKAAGYTILGKAYMLTGRYGDAAGAFKTAMDALANSSEELKLYNYNTQMAVWGQAPSKPYAWRSGYPSYNGDVEEVIFNKECMILDYTSSTRVPIVYVNPVHFAKYDADDLRRNFFADKNYKGEIDYSPYYRRLYVRIRPNMAADLPDLYLMYAECLARIDKLTEARELVTVLREHRMPVASAAIPASVSSKDDLIRFIVDERLREYMCMGLRWFDVRRLWNDPLFADMKKGYKRTVGGQTFTLTEDRLTYRIPPVVTKFHPDWKE